MQNTDFNNTLFKIIWCSKRTQRFKKWLCFRGQERWTMDEVQKLSNPERNNHRQNSLQFTSNDFFFYLKVIDN